MGVCERVGDLEMVEAVAFGQNITDFDYLVMMHSQGMVASNIVDLGRRHMRGTGPAAVKTGVTN